MREHRSKWLDYNASEWFSRGLTSVIIVANTLYNYQGFLLLLLRQIIMIVVVAISSRKLTSPIYVACTGSPFRCFVLYAHIILCSVWHRHRGKVVGHLFQGLTECQIWKTKRRRKRIGWIDDDATVSRAVNMYGILQYIHIRWEYNSACSAV